MEMKVVEPRKQWRSREWRKRLLEFDGFSSAAPSNTFLIDLIFPEK